MQQIAAGGECFVMCACRMHNLLIHSGQVTCFEVVPSRLRDKTLQAVKKRREDHPFIVDPEDPSALRELYISSDSVPTLHKLLNVQVLF